MPAARNRAGFDLKGSNMRRSEIEAIMGRDAHGQEGHLNTHVRDHDSTITSYGAHDRVIGTCAPVGGELYARVDHKWRLGEPTDRQVIDVLRDHQHVRGRWKVARRVPWDCGLHTDVYLISA